MKADHRLRLTTPRLFAQRLVAVGFSCTLLGVACGNTATTGGFGDDGGTSGSSGSGSSGGGTGSSNGASGSGGSGTGSSGSGTGGGTGTATGTATGTGTSSGSGSGASSGSTSGSSGGSSSGSGSGSSSGAGDSGTTTPPIPCGDGGAATGSSSGSSTDTGASCPIAATGVRTTEIDVGIKYSYQEVDTPLSLLSISPIPSGGSRLAFMGSDSMVHIAQLDANDNLVAGSIFGLPAFDFQDIYADNTGGVVLVSRNAMGGGTLNCGTPSNLCGTPPSPAIPCYDMYMVRFDSCGNETWATELTTSSAALPPYSTGPSGPLSLMIWWYAHNGRIAFDGTNYAGYYGVAISVSQGGCINIHQGDEMRIVNGSGKLVSGGFDIGCSHSSFERITWDGTKFVTVCNNDAPTGGKTGRIAFAPNTTTIYPVDELNTELGSVLPAGGGGYWITVTDLRAGQTGGNPGLSDVHLLHTTTGAPDKDMTVASDSGLNDRNPHLAAFGKNRMLAAWETSTTQAPSGGHLAQNDTSRKLYVQALDNTTGAAQGASYNVAGLTGSRYQDFRTYPDGSVAYAAPGSTATKIKILRVTPCK